MTATILVCDTCGFSDEEKIRNGRTAGEIFAGHVERAANGGGVRVRRHSCLMGCGHGCNAAIAEPGKITYVLGRFDPEPEAAEALVEYATKYAGSETGVVPYREWPQGVKGHFVSRVPPLKD
jgi:predicted metal-binding protein